MRIHRVVHDRIHHIRKVDAHQRGSDAAGLRERVDTPGRQADALPQREREAEHHLREIGDALAEGVDGHGGGEERGREGACLRQPGEREQPRGGLGEGEEVGGGGADGAAGDGAVSAAGDLPVEGGVEGVVPGAGGAAEEEVACGVDGAEGEEEGREGTAARRVPKRWGW